MKKEIYLFLQNGIEIIKVHVATELINGSNSQRVYNTIGVTVKKISKNVVIFGCCGCRNDKHFF